MIIINPLYFIKDNCNFIVFVLVQVCTVPDIPFSMYISKPEDYERTYKTGETITLGCKKGFKEKPGGNGVRICISGRWAQFPFECEGKNI